MFMKTARMRMIKERIEIGWGVNPDLRRLEVAAVDGFSLEGFIYLF